MCPFRYDTDKLSNAGCDDRGEERKSIFGTSVVIQPDREGTCLRNSGIYEGRPAADPRRRKYDTEASCRISSSIGGTKKWNSLKSR